MTPRRFLAVLVLLAGLGHAAGAASSPRSRVPDTLTVTTTPEDVSAPWRSRTLPPPRLPAREENSGPVLRVQIGGAVAPSFAAMRMKLRILHALGCDVVSPASPGPELTPDDLAAACRGIDGIAVVSANLRDARGNLLFPPYRILMKNGVRIGVTSIQDAPFAWFEGRTSPFTHHRFTVSDPESSLASVLPELRSRADVVVLLAARLQKRKRDRIPSLDQVDVVVTFSDADGPTGPAWMQVPLEGPEIIRLRLPLKPRPDRAGARVDTLRADRALPADADAAARLARYRRLDAEHDSLAALARLTGIGVFPILARVEVRDLWPALGRSRWVPLRHGEDSTLRVPSVRSVWGHIRGTNRGELSFSWRLTAGDTLPPGPFDLAWRPPSPLSLGDVQVQRGPGHLAAMEPGAVVIGSLEERAMIALLRNTVDAVLDWSEQDSLEGAIDPGAPPHTVPSWVATTPWDMRNALWMLGLARFLERQAASGLTETPRYWHRRGLVYLDLTCDRDGSVRGARVLENDAWPGAADSVAAIARGWTVAVPATWRWDRVPFTRVAAISVDRTESRLRMEGAASLPDDVRGLLAAGPPAAWWSALRAADPNASLADFVDEGPESLSVGRIPAASVAAELGGRERLGVLSRSPDGTRRLDPLAGWRIGPRGTVTGGNGVGVRFTGSLRTGTVWEWAPRESEIQIAGWTGRNRITALGWSAIDHPRLAGGEWVAFRVPTIWTLDLDLGRVRRFLGAPVPLDGLPTATTGCRKARDEAYPRLTWAE